MVVLCLNPEFSDSALIVSQQVLILKTSAAWLIADNWNRLGKICLYMSHSIKLYIYMCLIVFVYVFIY